jgi:hypothetical protein
MLALLLLGVVTADLPPYQIHRIAASDLRAVRAEDRPYTRYASRHGISDAEWVSFQGAYDLAANGASIRGDLYRPKIVGGGLLIRMDLRALGWDKFSRQIELDKLEKLGVKLNFKSDRDKNFYLDIWETIGYDEPYFVATDAYRRGWLNPAVVDAVEKVAYTRKLVVAAHWLYPRLLLERNKGGFYSQLLILPPTKADLEKRLGVFRQFADVDLRAVHGAAVRKSLFVSHNPREAQFFGSGTGWDQQWYSQTLDYLKSDRKEKDPFQSPAGTSEPDAFEVLFTTPNGLIGAYLANKQGNQAFFAPQDVAEDLRETNPAVYHSPTKTIFTPGKCWDCHGENRGMIALNDGVTRLINPPRLDTGYLVLAYDPKVAAREAQRMEEFYRGNLRDKLDLYRTSYEARVKELTGQDVLAATRNLMRWYDRYTPAYVAELVTPEIAHREMGYPQFAARAMWKAASIQGRGKPAPPPKDYLAQFVYQATAPLRDSTPAIGLGLFADHPVQGTDQLGFLAGGEPITRLQFDQVVGDALSQDIFSWDKIPVHLQVPHP